MMFIIIILQWNFTDITVQESCVNMKGASNISVSLSIASVWI